MNNERLKFRTWSNKYNQYVKSQTYPYGHTVFCITQDGNLFEDEEHSEWDKYPDPYNNPTIVVEQCLGLKDRNGKLIFEGDILRKVEHTFLELSNISDAYLLDRITIDKSLIKRGEEEKDYSGDSYVEVWYYGKTDIATMERFPHYWLKDEHFGYEGEEMEEPEDWEIVGNIHETPELLKN